VNEIVVAPRFNGPPGSGNGGYVCGLVARATGVVHPEVTLRRPPPLGMPLRVEDGTVLDGEHVVATAATAPEHDVTPPPFPGYDAAHAAEETYAGLHRHPFPTCFSCGPDRTDGLGLRPGRIDDQTVACGWTPDEVSEEIVWAALDCPGAWAVLQSDDTPIVLGRLAVRVERLPAAGEPHVVTGWRLAPSEGRKHFVGTALHDTDGNVLATGRATWVALQSGGS
jgi:hypothetical protein